MNTRYFTTDFYRYQDGIATHSFTEITAADLPETAPAGHDFSVEAFGHTDSPTPFVVTGIRNLTECRKWWKNARRMGCAEFRVKYNKL